MTNTIIRTPNREDLRSGGNRREGRYYHWKGKSEISVTNANKNGIPAPALMYWAPRVVAEYVEGNLDDVVDFHKKMDKSEFISYLKNLPSQVRNKAGEIGTAVHEAAEQYVIGAESFDLSHLEDDMVRAKTRQFVDFMRVVKPDVYAI